MAGGTPEDYYPEDEIVSIADQAIQTALDAIKGASTKRQDEVRPTPERRWLLAPVMQEKGSAEETWAVPELLQGPYKMFQDMHGLLAGGANPTDPEVIEKSLELALSITGGTVTAKAGGVVAKRAFPAAEVPQRRLPVRQPGEPKFDVEAASVIPVIDLPGPVLSALEDAAYKLDDFGVAIPAGKYEELRVPIDSLVSFQDTVGKEKLKSMQGALKAPSDLDAIADKPRVIRIGDQYVIMEGNHRANIAKLAGHEDMTVRVVGDITDQAEPYFSKGDWAAETAAKLMEEYEPPLASVRIAKEGNLSVHQNTDGDWILQGPGAVDGGPGHQTLNFGDDFASLQGHLAKMGKSAASEADTVPFEWKGPLKEMGLELKKNEDGNWVLSGPGALHGNPEYLEAKSFGKTLDAPHIEDHLAMLEDKLTDRIWKADEEAYLGKHLTYDANVMVDGKETTWGRFASANMDDPGTLQAVEEAYSKGIGHVVLGGGASPEMSITLPFNPFKAAEHKTVPRKKGAPTELERRNWPEATPIDTIAIDEAHPGPIIAYHGTSRDFIKFDLEKSADIGNHFGTQEQASGMTHKGGSTHQRVIPAYLDVHNPLTLPDLGGWYPTKLASHIEMTDPKAKGLREIIIKLLSGTADSDIRSSIVREAFEIIRKKLDELGYDSIRYENKVEGEGWSYIVWKPNTVKSATTPDHILYVRGPGAAALLPNEDQTMADVTAEEAYRLLRERGRGAAQPGAAPPPASALPAVPGTIVEDEGPDPLGIEQIERTSDPAGMSPEKEALSRSVFGMARKGSATLGRFGQSVADTITDLPQAMERAKTPGNMRSILRGTGGAAGGMAGVPFGPIGVGLGTFGGASIGGYVANIYDDFYKSDAPDKPALMHQLLQPLKEASIDASISGGIVALPYVVGSGKRLLAQLMRLPPNSAQLLKEASDIGVDIGVANVAGTHGIGGGAVNVMGRLPMLGGSAKTAARQQARKITAAYNDMFGQLAEQRTVSEMGQEALEEGTKKFTDFAKGMQLQYERAVRLGEDAGPIVKTNIIRGTAKRALAELEELPGGLKMQVPANARKVMEAASKLPDSVNTIDIKSIDYYLENALRKAVSESGLHYPKLAEVRLALRQAMDGTDHPAARMMSNVDRRFEAGLTDLGTDMAHKFGRVERNVFATGKVIPGPADTPDKVADLLLSLNSGAAVTNP